MANESARFESSGPHGDYTGYHLEPEADDELDLRELLRTLWRRRWLLLATLLLITGATFAYLNQLTPRYTAKTLIRVETREEQIVNLEGVFEELVADGATIESELEFLRSPAFSRQVAESQNLLDDPEFNPTLEADDAAAVAKLNPLRLVPDGWLPASWTDGAEAADALGPPPERNTLSDDEMLQWTAGNFRSRLDVDQVGRSYVLAVEVESEDPAKAARLADAAAEQYLIAQVQEKFEAAQRATDWLRGRIAELRQKVLEDEAKIAKFSADNRLTVSGNANPVAMQMSQLNTQLALAQATRAEADARLAQVRSLLDSSEGAVTATKVLSSVQMADLRAQETMLQRQLSELATTYGANHPQMLSLRADIDSVRSKITDEVLRIAQDLENEVAVAQARERELQRSLAALEGQAAGQDMASVRLRDLNREAETNRQLFETFLLRFQEIVEQQELQQADASVLSTAEVPKSPSYPRKKAALAVAFGAALLLGTLLVFLVERWSGDFGIRSAEEIQRLVGLRTMALVPDLSSRETDGAPVEEYIMQKPSSAFSEALQRVRTNLFLSAGEGDGEPKTILITSSVPGEGKTATASCLARQSARSGLRVLLIDCDLRRPRLHNVMSMANQDGLSDVLTGKVDLEDAIRRDDKSGLDFLPAGAPSSSPPDLFRSQGMKALLQAVRDYYDLVVLDSPPVAAVSDSFILSGLADKTVFVVRWQVTPRQLAIGAIRQIAETSKDLAGVVLSRVNVKKHAQYGYADSNYYRGYYDEYYTN